MAIQVKARPIEGQMLLPLDGMMSSRPSPTFTEEAYQISSTPQPIEQIGPHVDLIDRARSLAKVLPLIADLNRTRGFLNRADTEKGYKDLQAQYNNETTRILRNSREKKDRLKDEIRNEFPVAYGTLAVQQANQPEIDATRWTEEELGQLRHTNPKKRRKRLEQAEAYLKSVSANQ